jgi:hypothetical protein
MITTKRNALLASKKNYNIKFDTTTFTCKKAIVPSTKLQSKFFKFIASTLLTVFITPLHAIPINTEEEVRGIDPEHTFQQKEETKYVYTYKNFVVSQGNKYSQIWKNINNQWQEIAALNDRYRAIDTNNVSADGKRIALLNDRYTDNASVEIWQNTEESWKIIGEGSGIRVYFNPKNSNEIILQTYVLLDNTKDELRTALYNLKENNTWEKNTAVTIPNDLYCGGYSQDGKRLFFAGESKVIILLKDNSNNYIQHTSSLSRANKIFPSPVNNEFIVYRGCHIGFSNSETKNTCYVTHGRFNEEDNTCNFNELASFTDIPHPSVLDFGSSGNKILIGDRNDIIIFERQENNTWKTDEEFIPYANTFASCLSADETSIVMPSGLSYFHAYTKNTDGNWDWCCEFMDKSKPLNNTEKFEISSEENAYVSQAIFTPDSKRLIAVFNTTQDHGYSIISSNVVILEKYSNVDLGDYLKNRGSLILNGISNARLYINKNYIIAIEPSELKISIYDFNKSNQLESPSSI